MDENNVISLSCGASANVPFGEFGEQRATGYGFIGGASYWFSQEISLGAALGYLFWDPPIELLPGYADTFYDYPLALQFRYCVGAYNEMRPYLGAEYGFHFTDWTIKTPLYKETEKFTKTGASLSFGILIPFSEYYFLDACAKYTSIKDRFDFFSLSAGLAYEF